MTTISIRGKHKFVIPRLVNLTNFLQVDPSALGVGWVDLISLVFRCLPNSTWADESLADAALTVGKMVEQQNQSQLNPDP